MMSAGGGGLVPIQTAIQNLPNHPKIRPPSFQQSADGEIARLRRFADKIKEVQMTTTPRRLVQVYIADPDENIPLDKSLLYQGEQKLTDLTDQELFFEIDMAVILKKHNEMRVKQINKKVKERTEHLEPARIRDLKMVVVENAKF
jgi:hypothetical protein